MVKPGLNKKNLHINYSRKKNVKTPKEASNKKKIQYRCRTVTGEYIRDIVEQQYVICIQETKQ